jgi:hypothetical protein
MTMPDETDLSYIVVPYHKNTILVLTPTEFSRALKRGKAYRRSEALTHRVQQRHMRTTHAEERESHGRTCWLSR